MTKTCQGRGRGEQGLWEGSINNNKKEIDDLE
jgi:hypothetical protein